MAEAFLAGLALDTAKTVTNLVKARVLEEIKIAWDFKGNLKKLDKKLFSVQAFLNDLGSARYDIKSSFVNEWLQRFTDVVRSADEFMDDYKYELLCREVERQKKSGSLFRAATQPVVFHFLMSHRIKDILSQFDDLDKEASDAGIKKAKLATQAVASSSAIDESFHQNRKSAAANGAEYIGRKSDEEKLLSKILDSSSEEVHHHLSIVAIVGIGGLGKTTFARNLFNHKKVDDHIDEKIWICVSEHFKVNRILNDMLQYYTPTIPHLENTYAITNALQEKLKGKKLLLVLDDVWESNKNSWSSLRNELLSIRDLRGCVILITTRKIEVADAASAFYKHKLPGLSEDEGWALLKNTTFGESFRYDSSFNGVGRRIVKKCNGVPLAINVIGGVLKSKKFVSEWESIEKNKFWEFHPDDIKDILPSLLLSYNDLNRVYVKQCFAYCAIFPKDFQMEKRQLITLWLAQGFLHDEFAADNSTSTMELVGERYLNILLKCSFFEEEKDKSGVRTWYKMHDLMHDLAAYVSKKNLLIWNAETKAEAISNVQHLAFDAAEKKIPLDRLPIGKLRTISFWGIKQSWNNSTLGRARYMRTLILDGIGLKEVPIIIGKLVHLRYLDLSHNEFVVLPKSIRKLYQLQTLRVTGCSKLRKLPEELQWLSCLRHIETDNFLLASKGLRQLTNLQTLPPLELRDGDGWTIDELSPLDQVVGELKIRGLRRVKKKEALILRKKKIVKLHLEWDATTSQVLDSDEDALDSNEDVIYNDKDVLVSLKPHPNIQILYIDGFMGLRFPKWIGTTVNLVEVKLIGCRKSNRLPTFGQLPNLKILWLRKFDCLESIGGEFYESGSNISNTREEKVLFPSLTEIKIDHCRRLTTWIPPSPMQTAFPNLEVFHVRKCWKLTEVPVLHYKSLKHPKLFHIGGTQPLDIVKYNHGLWSLDLIGINDMVRLPGELPKCSNLLRLTVGMCEKLEFIPSGLISLKVLLINQCPSLACIPNDLFSLRDLSVQNCELLMSMPHVTSLEMLMISGCPLTASYQQWIPNLHRLQILNTDKWDFNQRTLFPQSLAKLSLTDFSFVKSLPQQPLQYLQSLSLIRFDELVTLPEWIGNLSYLDTLKLEDCKKLKKLPSPQAMQRLSRLHLISIKGCKLLKQTYDREDGPQWLRFVKWA